MGGLRHKLAGAKALTVLALSLAVSGVSPSAIAASSYVAPESTVRDQNGVDLASGILFRSDTFMTIGDPGSGGLSWGYSGISGHNTFDAKVIYYSQMTDINTSTLANYVVSIGESTTTFYQSCSTTTCNSGADQNATLSKTSTNWIYTTRDGTVYTFDIIADVSSFPTNSGGGMLGKLISVLKPDGTLTTVGYPSGCTSYCAFDRVVTNRGFAFKSDGSSNKLWAVNLLAHTCNAAVVCDAYDNYLSFGTFSRAASETVNGLAYGGATITDSLGNASRYSGEDITTYQDGVIEGVLYYEAPTGEQIAAEYDIFSRVKKITTRIGAWNYGYSDGNLTAVKLTGPHTVTLKDPANATYLTVVATKISPHASSKKDALNRTTSYQGQSYARPGTTSGYTYYMSTGSTLPEGSSVSYAYDARGNVTSITNTPKSGSGLTATSITASYPSACTYVKTCNQPTWTKDAKLNQTDYTYDNNHGGVLTVTLPADQNAIRQRTYNTYTAFDTGNGIIYRLTRTESCGLTSAQLSLTACPALSTTSVTVMNYGTSTTAPKTYKSNLPLTVTQTDGASSLAATTTYAYDNVGNVISVDGPLAGTADQSFTTYDANRRKIFEIGPIPGGTGTQKRTLVRHLYDGSGREIQTAQGYANSNLTNGSDAVIISYSQMNYDTAGRLAATIVETTGNVAP